MLSRVFFLSIVLVPATCGGAAPAPRTGDAEVRESANGLPCFTISEREERRNGAPNFDTITVYDPSSKPRAKMWTMSMPPSRTFPVLFSMCVPYGGRVQSLPQTAAVALETGKVYEVLIDVRAGDAPNQPRGYGARFCLAKRRDGSVLVHHIDPGAHEGRHLYGCIVPK
ncbi:MAG: hypothetical protein M3R60_14870 [Pseudomonadota bacterium]|nr:hypothetical protein [Pseudomonadota bacterium]